MKKKILIIGGTGFIGKNLVLKLRTKNFKIFSLSHSVDKRIIYKQHAKQIKCDITNKTELKKKLDNKFHIKILKNPYYNGNIFRRQNHYFFIGKKL